MTAVATATGWSLPGDARVPAEPPAQPSGKHRRDGDGGNSHAASPAPFHSLAHLMGEQQPFAYSTLPDPPPHFDGSSQINNTCSLKQGYIESPCSPDGNPSLQPSIFHSPDIIFKSMQLQGAASLSLSRAECAWDATGKLSQKSTKLGNTSPSSRDAWSDSGQEDE